MMMNSSTNGGVLEMKTYTQSSTSTEKQPVLLYSSDESSIDFEDEHRDQASLAVLGDENYNDKHSWHDNIDTRLIKFKNKKKSSKKAFYMPEDHVTLSFFACCVFCPVGLMAVLNSYKVQYYFDIGDIEKSRETSKRTQRLAKRAICIGFLIMACIFVFVLTLALIFTTLFKPNQYY